jgi:sodium/hydrogen exchanger 10/11
VEYNKLSKSLAERYKHSNSIKSIEPPAPKLIFREVTYLGDDEKIINYLYDNIATKKFDPGDVVFAEGEVVDGIYILITGTVFNPLFGPSRSQFYLKECFW